MSLSNWQRYLIKTVIMMLVYFIAGKLTFAISDNSLNNLVVSIVVFLPEGFALAGAIIFGRGVWLGIFLGQLFLALSVDMPIAPAIGISLVNSFEVVLAVTLIEYFKLDKLLTKVRDVVGLIFIIILVLQLFSTMLGNLVLYYYSIITAQEFIESLFSWWFGNSLAQLLITPALIYFYSNYKRIKIAGILLTILLFLLLNYIILYAVPIQSLPILLSITMPLVMLLAVYKNITYATIATVVTALSTIYATNMGIGAFSTGASIDDVIDINFYILSHIFLVLIMGTLFSEKKENEKTILKRNNELQELVKLREQVEYMNQHDLKNSLNMVINAPYLILNDEKFLSKGSKKLLEASQSSGYKMLDMINNSLDMYKMEVGNYILKPERINLLLILREVINEANISFQEKKNNHEIILNSNDIVKPEEFLVLGESLLCHSLFSNLIRNALEASSKKSPITIKISKYKQQCMISITNEGSVPYEIRNKFFEKFVSRNKKNGTGLGTYSARLCTEIQNGTIILDCSIKNKTRIIVRLPYS